MINKLKVWFKRRFMWQVQPSLKKGLRNCFMELILDFSPLVFMILSIFHPWVIGPAIGAFLGSRIPNFIQGDYWNGSVENYKEGAKNTSEAFTKQFPDIMNQIAKKISKDLGVNIIIKEENHYES